VRCGRREAECEAGNHDITLDENFFREHGGSWKWGAWPPDTAECRKLLVESESITYLENSSARITLTSPTGPGTTFTVFGSPCTPKHANWAFQYTPEEAEEVWSQIPDQVDVVITHTPPQGLCDGVRSAVPDTREGCPALLRRLNQVRPLLSICGHLHRGRGAERVRWRTTAGAGGGPAAAIEGWKDPGAGNKKMSLLDLTTRGGGCMGHGVGLTRQRADSSTQYGLGGQPDASLRLPWSCAERDDEGSANVPKLLSSRRATQVAPEESEAVEEAHSKAQHGGPYETCRDPGGQTREQLCAGSARSETAVVNAAYLGPRVAGKADGVNKAIVVDVELAVWTADNA